MQNFNLPTVCYVKTEVTTEIITEIISAADPDDQVA